VCSTFCDCLVLHDQQLVLQFFEPHAVTVALACSAKRTKQSKRRRNNAMACQREQHTTEALDLIVQGRPVIVGTVKLALELFDLQNMHRPCSFSTLLFDERPYAIS
jgi:hypothetical protein